MTIEHGFEIPERIWYANTDMKTFRQAQRAPGDDSAFAHWLATGKVIVSPRPHNQRQYHRALSEMRPGEPVFAYEDRVGFVGIGWITDPKMHADTSGGCVLYPDPSSRVTSIDVVWDTSVTRHYKDVSAVTKVGGHGVQLCDVTTKLYPYLLEMLQEARHRHKSDPDADEAAACRLIESSPAYSQKMRVQLGLARIGQGTFRSAVLAREPVCRVTEVAQPAHLVASHIKPWAACVDGEHLDGANGLMLAPHIDHLFDTGLISFTDDGQLIAAQALDPEVMSAWHIGENTNVGKFAPDQARYLAYHRLYVFGQPRPRRQRNLVGAAFDGVAVTGDTSEGMFDPAKAN